MQIRRDDRGATAVEYGLYVALVAGAMLAGVVLLTGALGMVFAGVAADPVIGGGTSTTAATPPPPSSTPTATAPGTARALAASSQATTERACTSIPTKVRSNITEASPRLWLCQWSVHRQPTYIRG